MLRFWSVAEAELGGSWLSCVSPSLQLQAPVTQLMDSSNRDRSSGSPQRAWKSQLFGCCTWAAGLCVLHGAGLLWELQHEVHQLAALDVVTCILPKTSDSGCFLSSLPGHLVKPPKAAENSFMTRLVTVNFLRKEDDGVACQRLEESWFMVYLLQQDQVLLGGWRSACEEGSCRFGLVYADGLLFWHCITVLNVHCHLQH